MYLTLYQSITIFYLQISYYTTGIIITKMYIISYKVCDFIYSTALQVVMDRMEQMERSMHQMERSMHQMERSMEDMRMENRRFVNIGPEMDQEIET